MARRQQYPAEVMSMSTARSIAGVERWRALCWQLMRMTMVSQTNILVGPSITLLLCAPKYIGGTITLGAMVQAAAAFAVVQGAVSWVAESFGRLAEWAASARRVGSLLHSLDQIGTESLAPERFVPSTDPSVIGRQRPQTRPERVSAVPEKTFRRHGTFWRHAP